MERNVCLKYFSVSTRWTETLMRKIDNTGTVDGRLGSGRPRMLRTTAIIDQVEDLVLSCRHTAHNGKCYVPSSRLLRMRPTFSKLLLLSVGILALVRMSMHFMDHAGVKINGNIIAQCFAAERFAPWRSDCSQSFTHSSKTAHRHTELKKQFSC